MATYEEIVADTKTTNPTSWIIDGADICKLGVGELRKLIRERFPVTKGKFSAVAGKSVCIGILSGKIGPETVVHAWEEDQKPKEIEASFEPDGAIEKVPAPKVNKLTWPRVREMLLDLNKEMVTAIDDHIDSTRKELVKKFKVAKPVEVLDHGDTVELHGLKLPKMEITEEHKGWIEERDPLFNFEAWNAQAEVAGKILKFNWTHFVKALMAGRNILLVGPPGVGKTALVKQVAALCQWALMRYNGNRDKTVMDLVGSTVAADGATHFEHGPLPTAMKLGGIFLNDEMDHNLPDLNSMLHSVMEKNGSLMITSNNGEVIKPHKNFRLVATANTRGQGDQSGIHSAAIAQDAAFMSRFDVVFDVNWIDPKAEENLLKSYYSNADDIANMVKTATACRKAFANEEIMYPVTTRHLVSWADSAEECGLAHAFVIAVLGKMPDCDRKPVSEIAQRFFGSRIWTDEPDTGGIEHGEPMKKAATAEPF